MNGYRAVVFEAHTQPGGVCTAWTRKGFTFDGCIHHLAGCDQGSPLHRIWENLGAFPREIRYPEDLVRVEGTDGKSVTLYTDFDRLAEELGRVSPQDGRPIGRYLRGVRASTRFELFDVLDHPARGLLSALPRLPHLVRSGGLTMGKAAERFRDPFLRQAFATFMYDWPETPLLIHLNILGGCIARRYGFPAGGSLAFSRSIAKRFADLGGEIHYGARVVLILAEDGRAVGVRLAGGSEHRGDDVLSNAYAKATVFDLLEGRFVDDKLHAAFAKPEDKVTMGLHVQFGLARDLSQEAHAIVLFLPESIEIAGERKDRLDLELFGFDPSLAPAGKGVLKAVFDTSWSYWRRLAVDRARYVAEKERIAETVLSVLERRFPGIESQVEAVDVATPLTTERYTSGAESFAGGSLFGMLLAKPRPFPGLRNVWMIGQSVGGAGLPGCAVMGRNAVRAIARRDGRHFAASPSHTG
jgi:phytoene dehydrogenase-like protein